MRQTKPARKQHTRTERKVVCGHLDGVQADLAVGMLLGGHGLELTGSPGRTGASLSVCGPFWEGYDVSAIHDPELPTDGGIHNRIVQHQVGELD